MQTLFVLLPDSTNYTPATANLVLYYYNFIVGKMTTL